MNQKEQIAEQILRKCPKVFYEDAPFSTGVAISLEDATAAIIEAMSLTESKYKIDPEHEKITGWPTVAEWVAFEKGYNAFNDIVIEKIEEWDGKATNSGLFDALKKKFEAMSLTAPKWIKASEKPQEHQDVLVAYNNDKTAEWIEQTSFYNGKFESDKDITHWMPLPAPPSESPTNKEDVASDSGKQPSLSFSDWLRQVKKEQKHYNLFNGVDINPDILQQMWKEGWSPVDTLNELSTAC